MTKTYIKPEKETESYPWLQIYGQAMWHDAATICGNRAALEALRNAIDAAITTRKDQSIQVASSDGEGYRLNVKLKTHKELDQMPVHYTDEMANPK